MTNSMMFLALLALVIFAQATHYEAREAHRHAHEIACAVGAVDLCKFHTEDRE